MLLLGGRLLPHKLKSLHHLVLLVHALLGVESLILVVDVHSHVYWLVNLVLLGLVRWRRAK